MLAAARDLVSFGWCRYADARNGAGQRVEPWSTDATSWSLLGALVAQTEPARLENGDLSISDLRRALGALALVLPSDSLAAWNDEPTRTADDVIRTLTAAIAQIDGREP